MDKNEYLRAWRKANPDKVKRHTKNSIARLKLEGYYQSSEYIDYQRRYQKQYKRALREEEKLKRSTPEAKAKRNAYRRMRRLRLKTMRIYND